jgi:hypothetical protein
VTGPGSATRSCGAAHAPWSGLDWEAKLSHLKNLHTRLAAVDLDAAQLAGEAAHDLVEALLRSLAAEVRGSGLAPRRGRHGLVAYLQAATAERLGSDQWMPIVTLAGPPWPAGRRDLALEVFAAANHPRSSAELPGQAIPAAHRAATTPPSLREVQ